MTYKLLKRVMDTGAYVAADMAEKLDVYYLYNRITKEEYEELVALIQG